MRLRTNMPALAIVIVLRVVTVERKLPPLAKKRNGGQRIPVLGTPLPRRYILPALPLFARRRSLRSDSSLGFAGCLFWRCEIKGHRRSVTLF